MHSAKDKTHKVQKPKARHQILQLLKTHLEEKPQQIASQICP